MVRWGTTLDYRSGGEPWVNEAEGAAAGGLVSRRDGSRRREGGREGWKEDRREGGREGGPEDSARHVLPA